MNFISTVQTSKKWGISSRRVMVLAKEGRIPDAIQIGSRWMIPENAEKPEDGRTKAARLSKNNNETFFRYPVFEGRDVSGFNPPLSSEELILKKAFEAFHACKFEESEKIMLDLLELKNNRYHRLHALHLACMTYMMTGRTSDFLECYGKLDTELKEDFPYRKEMESLIYEVNASIGMNDYFTNTFRVDPTYSYHESYLSHLATLCLVALNLSDSTHLKERDLQPYEYIASSLKTNGCYVDCQAIHFYLGIAYSQMQNISKMEFHYKEALKLSEKYCLYYQAALLYFYYGKTFDSILAEFSPDFVERIRKLSYDIHARYTEFTESTAISSIYGLLSSQDFIYVFYAVHGLKNKEVAKLLHLSESSVSKRYGEIYAGLGVKNKQEMVELYHSSTNDSSLLSLM